jgi:hypothetical protein
MSRSQGAVHTRTFPPSAARHESVARRRASTASGGLAGTLGKVAWQPRDEVEPAEWLAMGQRLGAIGRCSQWWIGDWIRYGTARWGERYAEAARVTGYDVASLRNMAWVASRFDLSLRSDKLSWSHHVLLAPLEPDEQRRWLSRAERERLSVADLRLELRSARGEEKPGSPPGGSGSTRVVEAADTCPHCGHRLDASTD